MVVKWQSRAKWRIEPFGRFSGANGAPEPGAPQPQSPRIPHRHSPHPPSVNDCFGCESFALPHYLPTCPPRPRAAAVPMSFTQKDRVELEELMQDFDRPVASSVMPRWQRKALRSGAGKASLSSSVVSSASACDVDLTGTKSKKRGCPGTPSRPPPSSPCKRSRVTKTPAKTPSATVRTRMRLLLLLRVAGGSTAVLTREPCTCLVACRTTGSSRAGEPWILMCPTST